MFHRTHLRLPLSKTRAYLLIVALAASGTTVAAVFDHARTGFENSYLWIPTVIGVLGAVVALVLAAIPRPRRSDIAGHVAVMLALIVTGVLGAVLHIGDNLTSRGVVIAERFISGAPFMAPLLFANTGLFGLVALLDPRSEQQAEDAHAASPSVTAPAG
jgi:FtsH-binding integral membrane protein